MQYLVVLILKSNENIEIWHFRISHLSNSSKPCENSLFEDVFKVSTPIFHTSSKSFDKAQYGLVDGVWQIIPHCLQNFLQLVDGIWLGLKCLVAFKHSSPDVVINRIKVRWVWGRHSYFLMKSLQLMVIQFWASFAVWAGALSRIRNQMAKATCNLQPIG